MQPTAGPPRRVYRLTPEGRRELEAITSRIANSRDLQARFLLAYAQARPLRLTV